MSLMADEARYFKEEQLSIVVRFAKGLEVEERFLKFIDCSNSKEAQSAANTFLDFVKQNNQVWIIYYKRRENICYIFIFRYYQITITQAGHQCIIIT